MLVWGSHGWQVLIPASSHLLYASVMTEVSGLENENEGLWTLQTSVSTDCLMQVYEAIFVL